MDKSKDSEADGEFDKAPYFNFNDDKVKFDTNRVDNTNDNYGSASGFLPKSLLSEEGMLVKMSASSFITRYISQKSVRKKKRSELIL
ncbi:MAG: hypothetical protein WC536_00040 [Patescibacteria group bacterium]